MTDIIFILTLYFGMEAIRIRRNINSACSPLGGFIVGCILAAMMIAIVRIPIYVMVYGWTVPFKPPPPAEFWSGIGSIAFWLSMSYWQIPGRVVRFLRSKGSK